MLEDLGAGRRFYDRRASGVGGYFFDSLFSEIDSLVLYAGVHRVHFGFHRLLAKRFPFAVYYRVISGEAVVFRVLDHHAPAIQPLQDVKVVDTTGAGDCFNGVYLARRLLGDGRPGAFAPRGSRSHRP